MNRGMCVYCGQEANPDLGGRPKCAPCMWTRIAGFFLSLALLIVLVWSKCK